MRKICSKCDIEKDISEFYLRLGVPRGQCRSCVCEVSATWKLNNPARQRAQNLRREFNIEWVDYVAMIARQGGGCAICGHVPTEIGKDRFQLDHDHRCCPENGKSCGKCIRGALCFNCNTALGLFRDSAENLEKAMLYLKGTVG